MWNTLSSFQIAEMCYTIKKTKQNSLEDIYRTATKVELKESQLY